MDALADAATGVMDAAAAAAATAETKTNDSSDDDGARSSSSKKRKTLDDDDKNHNSHDDRDGNKKQKEEDGDDSSSNIIANAVAKLVPIAPRPPTANVATPVIAAASSSPLPTSTSTATVATSAAASSKNNERDEAAKVSSTTTNNKKKNDDDVASSNSVDNPVQRARMEFARIKDAQAAEQIKHDRCVCNWGEDCQKFRSVFTSRLVRLTKKGDEPRGGPCMVLDFSDDAYDDETTHEFAWKKAVVRTLGITEENAKSKKLTVAKHHWSLIQLVYFQKTPPSKPLPENVVQLLAQPFDEEAKTVVGKKSLYFNVPNHPKEQVEQKVNLFMSMKAPPPAQPRPIRRYEVAAAAAARKPAPGALLGEDRCICNWQDCRKFQLIFLNRVKAGIPDLRAGRPKKVTLFNSVGAGNNNNNKKRSEMTKSKQETWKRCVLRVLGANEATVQAVQESFRNGTVPIACHHWSLPQLEYFSKGNHLTKPEAKEVVQPLTEPFFDAEAQCTNRDGDTLYFNLPNYPLCQLVYDAKDALAELDKKTKTQWNAKQKGRITIGRFPPSDDPRQLSIKKKPPPLDKDNVPSCCCSWKDCRKLHKSFRENGDERRWGPPFVFRVHEGETQYLKSMLKALGLSPQRQNEMLIAAIARHHFDPRQIELFDKGRGADPLPAEEMQKYTDVPLDDNFSTGTEDEQGNKLYYHVPNYPHHRVKASADLVDSNRQHELERQRIVEKQLKAAEEREKIKAEEDRKLAVYTSMSLKEHQARSEELETLKAQCAQLRKEREKHKEQLRNEGKKVTHWKQKAKELKERVNDLEATEQVMSVPRISWFLQDYGGLSRLTIACEHWHAKHAEAAQHLFGFATFADLQQHIQTNFPDVDVNQSCRVTVTALAKHERDLRKGGSRSTLFHLSPLEECLATRLYLHRVPVSGTVAAVFGVSRGRMNSILKKWTPRWKPNEAAANNNGGGDDDDDVEEPEEEEEGDEPAHAQQQQQQGIVGDGWDDKYRAFL